jgi:hypothetical protein
VRASLPGKMGCFRGAKLLFRKNYPLPLIKGEGIKSIGLLD